MPKKKVVKPAAPRPKGKVEVVPPDDDHPDFAELPPAPPKKKS